MNNIPFPPAKVQTIFHTKKKQREKHLFFKIIYISCKGIWYTLRLDYLFRPVFSFFFSQKTQNNIEMVVNFEIYLYVLRKNDLRLHQSKQ